NTIAAYLPSGHPLAVSMTMLLIAVLITPFIDNVSTAVVLSPIAVGLASRTGMPVVPLLMTVAIGDLLDFLTSVVQHNIAVFVGVCGYRFLDFPMLRVLLTLLCNAVAAMVLWLLLSFRAPAGGALRLHP